MRGLRRLKGGYTIEAAYIMGITLFSFATVVGAAYRLKDKTIKAMELHAQVEVLRYQEDSREETVRRSIGGIDWYLEISADAPDPENWLRMISLGDR